ncbi:MAG: hypothetical protein Q9186_006573 [Xanthomendoza sp. 1 TL-2023]
MDQGSLHKLTYHKQEDVEDLEPYSAGGYHPVNIGDLYSNDRYRIVHKLGWGSYSTVWLARDSTLNRYVALKIVVAAVSKDSTESRILRHLRKFKGDNEPGSGFILSLLDDFYIDGPNGRHLCLVTEPTRCSVGEAKEDVPFKFPIEIARAISAQAILGLRSLHYRGVIHGDLHTRNMLLALPRIDSMSVDEIYQHFHTPRQTQIRRVDGAPPGPEAPSFAVMPAQVIINCDEVSDPRICISDFGEAWLNQDMTSKNDLNTPVALLPPEATFAKDSIGPPADVWTLACSMYEILGERPLFEGFFPTRDDIIAEMVDCLGRLPQTWWENWRSRGKYFHEDGSFISEVSAAESLNLAHRIQWMGRTKNLEFSAEEAQSVEKMLRAMLEFEPAKRATAEDIVKSEWMTYWGLPSLRKFDIPI